MSALRFSTANEVYDAFPTVGDFLSAEPTGSPPAAFMRSLAAGPTPEDAITFCAFTLGRREAVWWACQCVRSIAQVAEGQEDPLLLAAEDWVREPEEDRRRTALQLGMESDKQVASAWLALAAGWSGGSISTVEGMKVPPASHMTPSAARAAILIALARVGPKERGPRLERCVEGGLRLMEPQPA